MRKVIRKFLVKLSVSAILLCLLAGFMGVLYWVDAGILISYFVMILFLTESWRRLVRNKKLEVQRNKYYDLRGNRF